MSGACHSILTQIISYITWTGQVTGYASKSGLIFRAASNRQTNHNCKLWLMHMPGQTYQVLSLSLAPSISGSSTSYHRIRSDPIVLYKPFFFVPVFSCNCFQGSEVLNCIDAGCDDMVLWLDVTCQQGSWKRRKQYGQRCFKVFQSLVYPKFSRSPPARPKSGWQVEIRASLVPSSKYVNAAGVGKSHVPTINLLLKVFAE